MASPPRHWLRPPGCSPLSLQISLTAAEWTLSGRHLPDLPFQPLVYWPYIHRPRRIHNQRPETRPGSECLHHTSLSLELSSTAAAWTLPGGHMSDLPWAMLVWLLFSQIAISCHDTVIYRRII